MANILKYHWPTALSVHGRGDKYYDALARQTPEEKAAALAAWEAMIPERYRTKKSEDDPCVLSE
jgi:hypothetical protein